MIREIDRQRDLISRLVLPLLPTASTGLQFYRKAAEVATYVYPLEAADVTRDALFVEWVSDLEEGHKAKEMAGFRVILMSSCAFFAFSIPMLFLFHYSSPAKAARKRSSQYATIYRAI